MKRIVLSVLAGTLVWLSPFASADTVKGRIIEISKKAGTIQLEVKGQPPAVVRFDSNTQFEGASGIGDLSPPDLLKVDFDPGKPASKITKVVFGLPPGIEIDIQELLAVLQGKRGPYLLGDARPEKQYVQGHVPSAVATPVDEANPDALLAKLPEDKGQLLIFYCGGPTCPFTGQAVDIAMKGGYTNVKGFQEGIPGWKKAKLPVHANRGWVAKNLDEHHVIIDVRDPKVAGAKHIPTAVTMPAAELAAMTQKFIEEQKVAQLPGVTDMKAPIIVYAESQADPQVLQAFKEIRSWGYSNVAVLEGGLDAWVAQGLPTASNQLADSIQYTKKLAEGAIPPKEFAELEKSRDHVTFVDVRSDAEVAQAGMLKGAKHIPLDSLDARIDELPKDDQIVTYCENGIRAEMAYQTLRQKGFNVRFLNEAIQFDGNGGYSM